MEKNSEKVQCELAALQEKIQAMELRKGDLKNSIPNLFLRLLADMRDLKGNDRTPSARQCAIIITQLEGAYARFTQFVLKE